MPTQSPTLSQPASTASSALERAPNSSVAAARVLAANWAMPMRGTVPAWAITWYQILPTDSQLGPPTNLQAVQKARLSGPLVLCGS